LIIAGNFKSFKTREGTKEYLEKLEAEVLNSSSEVVIFPPSTALQSWKGKVSVGTQNAYPTENGAFTGEIGLEQLEEFQTKYILIGHSERREILKERDKFIAEKFDFFTENSFKVILCIGESLEIRREGEEKVLEFLNRQLEKIDLSKDFVIAYEPIWAIGTGITPTLQEIDSILEKLHKLSGKKVLYGGSVKLSNSVEILSLPNCDGVLVGGASLEPLDFAKMVSIADEVQK
jgi:triosephosphate isomerase